MKVYSYSPAYGGVVEHPVEIGKEYMGEYMTVMMPSGLTGQRVPKSKLDSGESHGYWTTPRKATEHWVTKSEERLTLMAGVLSAEDTRLWKEEIKKAKKRLSEME
jgi:hypothetical protein